MIKKAIFAGGCFWCMIKPFDKYDGVLSVVSGYTGGNVKNPTYKYVCSGATGHREAVCVTYDDEIISYEKLLEIFWGAIDPTDEGGQFNDRGEHYKTAIYYFDEEQKNIAEKSKEELQKSNLYNKPIAFAKEIKKMIGSKKRKEILSEELSKANVLGYVNSVPDDEGVQLYFKPKAPNM